MGVTTGHQSGWCPPVQYRWVPVPPPSAPKKFENDPMPARVIEKLNRWSFWTGAVVL